MSLGAILYCLLLVLWEVEVRSAHQRVEVRPAHQRVEVGTVFPADVRSGRV